MRAHLDDFKHPWRHVRERGYDRLSGEGYYRNAYDHASVMDLLLRPAHAAGCGMVTLCAHDPLTGEDHRSTTVQLPSDAVLVVDSVFALRPEYAAEWDYRIWLEVDPDQATTRAIERDRAREGAEEASRLHLDRYRVAERIYLTEVHPESMAGVVIDNSDLRNPRVVRRRST